MTMRDSIKKVFAVVFCVFVLGVMYYGTYLPYNKSQLYISFLQNLRNINSLGQLESEASIPLDAPSPIGQEELVRNFSNNVVDILHQNTNPMLAQQLLNYMMSYYGPIIQSGHGINFVQNILIVGMAYQTAGTNTKNQAYLDQAENYFKEGLSLSPRRPQFLYSLFSLYLEEKRFSDAKSIMNQILTYWPDDPTVQKQLTSAENQK
ncbi:tetratricopeptide repeat protein [Patescibacteria group bacterium]|nr:tetratricopeptide repeat protein [Patescibacteria group bacterium]MCL5733216.1 tetratricopeptide repeat protein [Patescibacteria group bacterium]